MRNQRLNTTVGSASSMRTAANRAPDESQHGIAACLRTGVASLAVSLVSVLGAPSAVHAAHPAAHPVSADIQPGAVACIPSPSPIDAQWPILCGTLGFVLKDQHGRRYITVSAHGYPMGARAYVKNDCCKSEGFGTVIIDDDSQDPGYPDATDEPVDGSDVALVEIDKHKYGSVSPSVRYWTGPTGVAGTGDGQPNDLLYVHDLNRTTSDTTAPHDRSPRMARLLRPDIINNNNFFYDDGHQDGEPQEYPGSSGAPFLLAENGKALGLNGNCHCGTATFGYPTLDYVLRRFSLPKYRPDLKLELDTAPYHPPLPPERN